MINSIIQIYKLEEILEIIDLDYKSILSNSLNESLSNILLDIDYLKLEELKQKIGNIGEEYVFIYEKQRLKKSGSKYAELVDRTPAKDPKNGFDILSFTENGTPIYIEVKSTIGDANTPFYITKNEKETANRIRNNGGIYQIHRVYNVGNKISSFICENDNKFIYEEELWRVSLNID